MAKTLLGRHAHAGSRLVWPKKPGGPGEDPRRQAHRPHPGGEGQALTSASAALARVVQYRLRQLGVDTPAADEATPVMDQLMSPREPRVDADGTFVLDGRRRQCRHRRQRGAVLERGATGGRRSSSVQRLARPWAPTRENSTVCASSSSIDMRVIDPAWIGLQLRPASGATPSRWVTSRPRYPGRDDRRTGLQHRRLHRASHDPPLRHAQHPGQRGRRDSRKVGVMVPASSAVPPERLSIPASGMPCDFRRRNRCSP
ncbi:MAG: hypothetical protein MZW92_60725 [Comamonadaceae bacterium]|nr:hypothetical protein [Comamonadaceae bacterium]